MFVLSDVVMACSHYLICYDPCSDHSLYYWDTSESPRFGKIGSHLYHNGAVWCCDVYEASKNKHSAMLLPPGTVITGGQDETVSVRGRKHDNDMITTDTHLESQRRGRRCER